MSLRATEQGEADLCQLHLDPREGSFRELSHATMCNRLLGPLSPSDRPRSEATSPVVTLERGVSQAPALLPRSLQTTLLALQGLRSDIIDDDRRRGLAAVPVSWMARGRPGFLGGVVLISPQEDL